MSGNNDIAAASYAGLHGAKMSKVERLPQIGRAPSKSRAPRWAPVDSIQKLGREDWRADERSPCAAIAEESAQDSQYLTSLSICYTPLYRSPCQ